MGRGREKVKIKANTTAEAYLELLSLRGIDYFFANAGTDFISIVEAFASRMEEGRDRPQPVTVPHEIPLVSMAHGYYLATGRPQMAMVHVGIGSANGLGALMHAHRARVPILLSAGRTPVTEEGDRASRNIFIHWGQESFDQAGMVREYVKWDYELRTPAQLETVLDRAMAMAMTEPRGPVYITLPREVLASAPGEMVFHRSPRCDLPTAYPDPAKINEAAELLCRADFPLIITSAAGRQPDRVRALTALAEDLGIGVIAFNPEYMNFPTEHFCHQGFSPDRLLPRADVILVVDCDVPWYPNRVKPRDSAVVIQAGIDPLYSTYPIRGFPSDLTIQGDPAAAISEMARAAKLQGHRDEGRILSRKEELERMHQDLVRAWEEDGVRNADEAPLDPLWVCRNVQRILTEKTVVINERDNGMHPYTGQEPGSYFCTPHAGYLGWGVWGRPGLQVGLSRQNRPGHRG